MKNCLSLVATAGNAGDARILAVFEPRSNTMKMDVHRDTLAKAFAGANVTIFYQPEELSWDLQDRLLNKPIDARPWPS